MSATWLGSIVGSGLVVPSACRVPALIDSVIDDAALPMSIWPHAMSNSRPSNDSAFVRPVIACLVAV